MEKVTYFSTEGKRFFRHDGKCIECNIVKQTIERHKIDGDWQYDHTITVSNNGREYDIKPEDLFESVELFERNRPLEPKVYDYPKALLGFYCGCYYVKDSQVLSFDIENKWRTLIYDGMEWTCPELPEKYYGSEDSARAYNTIRVVNQNGVETEKVGINLLLRLTDAQRAIVKEIEALFVKAKEAGIKFFHDTECDSQIAVNTLNVESVETAYENECGGEEAPIWNDKEFKMESHVYLSYCDCAIWAVRKSEPQS